MRHSTLRAESFSPSLVASPRSKFSWPVSDGWLRTPRNDATKKIRSRIAGIQNSHSTSRVSVMRLPTSYAK
jgi:hypothetical protein